MAGETTSREELNPEEYCTENFIKLETCSPTDLDNTSDFMETEEANGVCEEFDSEESQYLNPLDNLELVHLDGMNKILKEDRCRDSYSNVPFNSDNVVLQVKSIEALNNVAESDVTFNPFEKTCVNKAASNTLHVQGTHQSIEFVHVPGVIIETKSQVSTTPSSSNLALDDTTLDTNCTVAEHVYGNIDNIPIHFAFTLMLDSQF